MFRWIADLHVHTLLSPCADIEMTPRNIIRQASGHGINLVAITDHNVSANVPAALQLGQEYDVTVWPGVEVETSEGGHVVVLFDGLRKLAAFQAILDQNMNGLKNDPVKLGAQFVVDEQDELIKEEDRLLLAAVKLNLHTLTAQARELGGLCVAAHIDRPAYSMLSYLGFLPQDAGFAAVEISKTALSDQKIKKYTALSGGLPYITSSDAHTMDEFITGAKTHIYMEEPTIKEFSLALAGIDGRRVEAGQFSVQYRQD